MISCLENYIGLLDVTTDPGSGRYINELPGLTTNRFSLTRKSEAYDIDTAWQDIERRAIRKFEQRLIRWADKYKRMVNLVVTQVTGQVDSNTVPTTGGNHYVGWLFSDWWTYSQSALLNINWVQIYAQDAVTNGTIRIFNASTGDVLDTITYSASAGTIKQIPINKQYPFWKYPNLFIAYDDSEITTRKISQLYGMYYGNTINQGKFQKTGSVLAGNIQQLDNNGQGLVLNYNVACGVENYVCQRLANFEEPFMYLLGAEFCLEGMESDRISQYTLLDYPKAERLRNEFMEQYDEMIEGQLSTLVMNQDDYCWQCEQTYNYAQQLP